MCFFAHCSQLIPLRTANRQHTRVDKDHAVLQGTKAYTCCVTERVPARREKMIYSIISLLLAIWVVGLFMHIGGGFIHTLLALALVVFVYDLLVGRRAV